jgi:hypothetical protein
MASMKPASQECLEPCARLSGIDRFARFVAVAGSLVWCSVYAPPAEAAPAPFVVESDVATGITSDADVFVSLRYMRHLWITSDGVQATVVQQGTNGALGLYKSVDTGSTWTWEQDLPSTSSDISDGVMLADDSLLLVTSIVGSSPGSDVEFMRLDYDAGTQQWELDPLSPTTVYDSNNVARASRATIAVDSNGVLWSAFRLQNTTSANYRLRLFSSSDDGVTWQDSLNVFGTANAWAEKDAKVLATGTGIGIVFQDVTGPAASPVRSKRWAFRNDAAPLQSTISSSLIAQMVASGGDPYGSHWTVAADSVGNVHMSYQDNTIIYQRFDAGLQTWSSPLSLGSYSGSYNSISVTGNDDVWVFARLGGGANMWVKYWESASQQWSGWNQVSTGPHSGLLRMCSPERVDDELPLLYQVNASAPFELLYCLLDV